MSEYNYVGVCSKAALWYHEYVNTFRIVQLYFSKSTTFCIWKFWTHVVSSWFFSDLPGDFDKKKVSRGEKGRANRLSYSFLKKPSSFKDSFLETCSMSRSARQLQEIPQHVEYMRYLNNVNCNTKYVDDQMLVMLHFLQIHITCLYPHKNTWGWKHSLKERWIGWWKLHLKVGLFLDSYFQNILCILI